MRIFSVFKTAGWLGLAAGLLMTLNPAWGADTATNVFGRHFAAAGGREAFEKIETVVARGTGHEGGSTFTFELSQKKPGCMLLIIRSGDRVMTRMGRDNQARCWHESRDQEIRDLPKEEQGRFMELSIGLFPPSLLFFSERLAQSPCEEVQDQGRTLIALGKEGKESMFSRPMFDKTSGLLARVGAVHLEDYRQVQNIKLPFKLTPDGRSVFQIESMTLNTPLDDSLFRKPARVVAAAGSAKQEKGLHYTTLLTSNGTGIVRKPEPMTFGREKLASLPSYDPANRGPAQVDLRGYDLRGLDLSKRLGDLWHADFDDGTKWPSKVPAEFDRDRIMVLGKDPGLGVRKLHERGITGNGVGIGIIDQTLLVDHSEYANQLKLYEEFHNPIWSAQMHGPAVASIAVGKTVGVAPKADLYYIAETHGIFRAEGQFDWDYAWLAKAVDRLLEVNNGLPMEKKIRVISMSIGWMPDHNGYKEIMAAVERAKKQKVFVISTSLDQTHQLEFNGLGRPGLADPNDFNSYGPGSFWTSFFWAGQMQFKPGQCLMVPMDSRTTASPTGAGDYVFYSSGGASWAVPWVAGLYALACEVKPDITPELFWAVALKTGRTETLRHEGADFQFGVIADPVALIESLRAR